MSLLTRNLRCVLDAEIGKISKEIKASEEIVESCTVRVAQMKAVRDALLAGREQERKVTLSTAVSTT
jgi:hypothetical protein